MSERDGSAVDAPQDAGATQHSDAEIRDGATDTSEPEGPDASDAASDDDGAAPTGCIESDASSDAGEEDAGPLEAPDALNDIPDGLWEAPSASLPAQGSYVYLAGDAGNFVLDGQTYVFTPLDAALSVRPVSPAVGSFSINVMTDRSWNGFIAPPVTANQLAMGYYSNSVPAVAGALPAELRWGGEGRSCSNPAGWFVIDHVAFRGDELVELDMRFEQQCNGNVAALRGKVHWLADDPTLPAGPLIPPPDDLWRATTALPAGNYVHLAGEPGEYVTGGMTETYETGVRVSGFGNRVTIYVDDWVGELQGMSSVRQLIPGYYGNLNRYPFHNSAFGGLDWSGRGRGCNRVWGWFVIDDVAYECGLLTALDLRFEQRCDGAPPLRAQIHYIAPPRDETP